MGNPFVDFSWLWRYNRAIRWVFSAKLSSTALNRYRRFWRGAEISKAELLKPVIGPCQKAVDKFAYAMGHLL